MEDFSGHMIVFIPHAVFRTTPPLLRKTYQIQKLPERIAFRGVWFVLLYDLGLADGVDVTSQVEHLVGEAPLVVGDPSCLPRSLRSPVPGSAVGMPRFAVSCLCSVSCYGSLDFLGLSFQKRKPFSYLIIFSKCQRNKSFDPFCSSWSIFENVGA